MSTQEGGFPPNPNEKLPDPFEKLDPKDGFHVVKIECGGNVNLHCISYAGGKLVEPSKEAEAYDDVIFSWPTPMTERHQGEATRMQLALDGVARFLTTGGQWDELYYCLQRMRRSAPGGIDFSGYYYLDGYSTTEGTYQHIFVKAGSTTGEAVLWEEPDYTQSGGLFGGFIDRTTLHQIRKDQEDDESIWGRAQEIAAEEAKEPTAPPYHLQLSDREEPEPAGPPDRDHV